ALEHAVPCGKRTVQQVDGSNHIRDSELCRSVQRAIDMRFGCEVNDTVDLIASEHVIQELVVKNVSFFKVVIGLPFYVPEVFEIPGVREFVEVDDGIRRIVGNKSPYDM